MDLMKDVQPQVRMDVKEVSGSENGAAFAIPFLRVIQ